MTAAFLAHQLICDNAFKQKRDILSDPKLPAEFRLALARSLQNDLFCQVRAGKFR
jgi:hypothetical protein